MSDVLEQAAVLVRLLLTLVKSDAAKRVRKAELSNLNRLSEAMKAEIRKQDKKDAATAALLDFLSADHVASSTQKTADDLFATDDSRQITAALIDSLDADQKQYAVLVKQLLRKPSAQVFNDKETEELCITLVTRIMEILEHLQVMHAENLAHCREESFKASACLGGAVTPAP